ncbi:MAG: DUF1934 domain-containing protein [Clostridia bacterium]|nr:DUF1934 domain-containing protein [Clostridia bacterium]
MNKYILNVSSKISANDESETIELTTVGNFSRVNNKWIIAYSEVIDDSGVEVKTLVRVTDDEVIITRNNDSNSRLIMKLHERNLCHYGTEYGPLMLGVFCSDIKNKLNENGGSVEMTYTLDVNAAVLSTNEVNIKVREVKSNV